MLIRKRHVLDDENDASAVVFANVTDDLPTVEVSSFDVSVVPETTNFAEPASAIADLSLASLLDVRVATIYNVTSPLLNMTAAALSVRGHGFPTRLMGGGSASLVPAPSLAVHVLTAAEGTNVSTVAVGSPSLSHAVTLLPCGGIALEASASRSG